jgi:Lysine methyltransferase
MGHEIQTKKKQQQQHPPPKQHVLTIRGQPIVLEEHWDSGIGGGLWSTGLALAKYLDTKHAQDQLKFLEIRTALELGSGNGFLSMCLWAACCCGGDTSSSSSSSSSSWLEHIVVTDTKEHLALIQSTVDLNLQTMLSLGPSSTPRTKVQVMEYLWGTGPLQLRDDTGDDHDKDEDPPPSTGKHTFDLIIGSDLAYRDCLHDPLIDTLVHCSHLRTVILLGVTMNDTKPIFFSKLTTAGFQYEKLADHCMDPSFRGTNFGIFIIQQRGKPS